MTFSRKNILIGVAVILLLGGAYLYFFPAGSDIPLSVTDAPSATEQKFLDLAAQLTSISFNTAFFDDPRFTSLVDLSTPITPEVRGRIDPFSPLGQ